MNIKVFLEPNMPSHLTGGEYAHLDLEINIDAKLPIEEQRMLVIHSVIENYCQLWTHPKVEQLTELIGDALQQLEEVK